MCTLSCPIQNQLHSTSHPWLIYHLQLKVGEIKTGIFSGSGQIGKSRYPCSGRCNRLSFFWIHSTEAYNFSTYYLYFFQKKINILER